MRITVLTVATAAFAFCLLTASCGAPSSSGPADSGGGEGGCGSPPPLDCGSCNGTVEAECVDGTWQCPELGIACPYDAGPGDAGGEGDGAVTGDR
jgi:hypothetical protein